MIQGERVTLRLFSPEDMQRVISWSQDVELEQTMDWRYPTSPKEYQEWLDQIQGQRARRCFAIETKDGQCIGEIELANIAWRSGTAELRVAIGDQAYRGKGLGRDAVHAILNYAFSELDLTQVHLRVYTTNERAINCYLNSGFRKEGLLHRHEENWRDILLMSVTVDAFLRTATA